MLYLMSQASQRPQIANSRLRVILTLISVLGCNLFSFSVNAKVKPGVTPNSLPVYTAEELFKLYKPAIVKIVVRQENIPVAVGAGFFVSNDGLLITNHHVMRSAIAGKGFSVEFTLGNGKLIHDYKISDCGDDRGIDLCLLKLNTASPKFFKAATSAPAPGQNIFVIGHPRGLDFSISNGIVSAVRASSAGVEEVQISAAISPGNSGGPIFDVHGGLVGVATKFLKEGQNLNFGILATEVTKYLDAPEHTSSKAFSIAEARKRMQARIKKTMLSKAKELLEPAVVAVTSGRSLREVKGFKESNFDFGNESFKLALPEMFDSCVKQTGEGVAPVYACFARGDSAVLSVQRLPATPGTELEKLTGKTLVVPRPVSVVEGLIQDGQWADYEKKMTPAQRLGFYSHPGPATCQTLRANSLPKAFFSALPICKFTVAGENEPEAVSTGMWIERGPYVYSFTIWMEDQALGDFFNQVASVAILSAHGEGQPLLKFPIKERRHLASVPDKPASFYQFTVPEEMEFNNAKLHNDGAQYDTYSLKKAMSGAVGEATLVIDRRNSVFRPTDFEAASHELLENMTRLMHVTLKKETIESEVTTLDGLPGRLMSGFGSAADETGTGAHKDVLILMILAFGPNDTYLLTQKSQASKPENSFKLFKSVTSSFKRK